MLEFILIPFIIVLAVYGFTNLQSEYTELWNIIDKIVIFKGVNDLFNCYTCLSGFVGLYYYLLDFNYTGWIIAFHLLALSLIGRYASLIIAILLFVLSFTPLLPYVGFEIVLTSLLSMGFAKMVSNVQQ